MAKRLKKLVSLLFCIITVILNIKLAKTSCEEIPVITRWLNNREAAVSLRFDDTLESHVILVVPLLNEYNLKATFMVNPGKRGYEKFKTFWEAELPRMGHHLGNHTMHHRGANTVVQAEYEIGEASRQILDVCPQQGKLLAFAAGGRQRWGGKLWENASAEYTNIVRKYALIDLYDGNHPAKHVDSNDTVDGLCNLVRDAIREKNHQAFVFHHIGRPQIKDYLKFFLWGFHLSFDTGMFKEFLQCLHGARYRLWMAPLTEIYKYETELTNTRIENTKKTNAFWAIKVQVNTDPILYDQKLTLMLPLAKGYKISKVIQENQELKSYSISRERVLVDISPVSSHVYGYFRVENRL